MHDMQVAGGYLIENIDFVAFLFFVDFKKENRKFALKYDCSYGK